MKNTSQSSRLFRWSALTALLVGAFASVGCMTTYDAYGRPMQTVDPGVAVAGAVAAGALGYALANDNHGGYYHNYHRGYYGPRPYRHHY